MLIQKFQHLKSNKERKNRNHQIKEVIRQKIQDNFTKLKWTNKYPAQCW